MVKRELASDQNNNEPGVRLNIMSHMMGGAFGAFF